MIKINFYKNAVLIVLFTGKIQIYTLYKAEWQREKSRKGFCVRCGNFSGSY